MRVSERIFIRHVQNRKIGKPNNFKIFGTMKTKVPNQDTKVSFEWEISFGLIIIILFRNCIFKHHNLLLSNQVGDVMVSVFASSVVDRGFKP